MFTALSRIQLITIHVYNYLLAPTLEVVITPTSVTVLDVAPYNIFVLTCTATQPSSVSVTKTIEWRETRNGVTEAIIADNSSANITNNDLGSPTSTSHLSVRLNDAGDRVISCTAILQVPEDPAVSLSASAEVTVKGISFLMKITITYAIKLNELFTLQVLANLHSQPVSVYLISLLSPSHFNGSFLTLLIRQRNIECSTVTVNNP